MEITGNTSMSKGTMIGGFIVEESGFDQTLYPGYNVCFERNGKRTALALIEVDQDLSEDNPEPMLKIHLYGPGTDEPVIDHCLSAKQIDQMCEEEIEYGNN